ncbi:metal-binding protein ZinT [Klebsiella aerogenes]|uniref:metal-binding protein ZinT n=1 Tax=Klebsiella TaxID=570 RepID=UPI000DE0053B|nr:MULTISPECIES: metal-binding protein ZinT [Klebsiella]EKZ9672682.1 metal-binding protein ZinT [Klebsiella aerogenes]ELA2277450.1 metal-binding protein ZinT [Klebsiella aerogenes]ELT7621302.1 metal-binding protein ZinT [Klebsiella aerogenes]ELY3087367.1 metal-binding protein ZinT [Klebsiella aerogenes]MDQ8582504.1 metal-binding protein ZinT [Klebsiella aerogenes]
MTRKIPMLAFGFGIALAGAQAFAHGNHSHGPALTETERQASEGIFADKDVKDRALSDWDGVWQSVYPYLLNGDLDPVLEQKAKKPGAMSVEEYRAYYKKGYATDVEQIGIEDGVIEFHVGKTVNSCKYTYSGYKILQYASGKKGVRYLFECQQGDGNAPKFVQFSDHIISPRKSQHFHIFMGNESQEALLKEMDNWPTYYPYALHKEQIVDEMLHH